MTAAERNNVVVSGRGEQPMLFAHGYGCDQNMWRFVTGAFANDYKLVLFDHVGHGRSDVSTFRPEKYASLEGYADDVIAICDEFGLHDVIFVGHSVSAMIGLLAAIRRPELFERLVMIGSSPCYIDEGDYVGGFKREDIEGLLEFLDSNHLGWASTMAPVIMGNADRPELAEELANSFCRTDPEVAKHFARVTFLSDNRADLPRLQAPTLILQCSEDIIAPRPVGEYMHRVLPDSTLAIIENVGHCPHLSAPAASVAAMEDFLAARGL